jgi:hypothetical protein
MNTMAAVLIMLWVTGWTLACVRAGLRARCRAVGSGPPGTCRGPAPYPTTTTSREK